jgi:uncharacterized protein YlxP (DUF503 family)
LSIRHFAFNCLNSNIFHRLDREFSESFGIPRNDSPAMTIAKLTFEISIPHAQSLKDRRQVVRSLKDKLRHGFNVGIAELDDASLWNRATLGVVAISASTDYLTGQMREVDDTLHRLTNTLGAEILDSWVEFLPE